MGGIIYTGYFKDPILKELIHVYKYQRVSALSEMLAGLLIQRIKEEKLNFDIVAFVPLSRKRKAWRGFNQAEEIARLVATKLKKPLFTSIEKTKETKTQVGLPKKKREKNLAEVFKVKDPKKQFAGKRVLLVDDVTTTGTTLNECAKSLKNAGARVIWGAVIAKE